MKDIEVRLESATKETNLPRFEQIVEHLRERQNLFNENGCDLIDSSLKLQGNSPLDPCLSVCLDLDDISIVSTAKRRPSTQDMFASNNYDSLLKKLIPLVSQLLSLMDKTANQHIIEKATVYLLWIFYDASNHNHLLYQHSNNTSSNIMANMSSNFAQLEYIFCIENLNSFILEDICKVSSSLFELMDQSFLNTIFFYPSMVRKAAHDVEMQDPNDQDWFSYFEQEVGKRDITIECVDPFENASFNFFPVNNEDLKRIKESATNFGNFNFNYTNSEFILQNLISSNSLPMAKEFSNMNVNSANESKLPAKARIDGVDRNDTQQQVPEQQVEQSTEDAIALLFSELTIYISNYNSTHSEVYYLNHEELFNTILNWVIENNPDEDLCIELTNLLGEDSASLITKIITFYKPNILRSNAVISQTTTVNNETSRSGAGVSKGVSSSFERAENLWKKVCQAKGASATNLGPSIVVHTEKEKVLKKEMRKIEKKYREELSKAQKTANNELGNDTEKLTLQDLEMMREQNLKASIRAAFEPRLEDNLRPAQQVEKYPFVFDLLQTIKTTASYISETKLMLPSGFQKRDHRTHEEVIIPLISSNEETKEFLKNFPQIEIKDTDEFCRLGFDGFTRLNLIQSTVFQTAYLTDNQNMLICAPTGAGKTNIAMLAILNILRTYSVDGTAKSIKNDQFKIVYIAPMKALCAEMTASFGKRLEPFGVKVRELTGDMQLTSKEIMETQMLVVTPEKWDIVTRKSVGDVQLLDLVRLIIIDEVHLLQSDRGHVLETLVARTIRYVEQAQKCVWKDFIYGTFLLVNLLIL